MIYEVTDTAIVSPLFGEWPETLIWSCLQGVMGKVYANDAKKPTAAMAILGDFIFFAGQPDEELAAYRPSCCTRNSMIAVPQNASWQDTILQIYGGRAKEVPRYAIKKEPGIFDKGKLEKIISSLPKQYTLSMIDERLYELCKTQEWSADFVSQFPEYEMYRKMGLGAVICEKDCIVSGASSYSRYRDGIEIEIDTKKEYRRRGLALVCGAKLIVECLKRDLYPSWDAQNNASVALAEKLGYHYSHPYTAIEITGYVDPI